MRTIWIPFLALALPGFAQQSANPPVSAPDGMGCSFQPLYAKTLGEHIQVAWASPACKPAKMRVYRRNSAEKAKEQEIHPAILVADRNDTTFAICWDTLFTELGIYEYRIVPEDSLGVKGRPSAWAVANNLHDEISPWVHSISAKDVPGERSIRLHWSLSVPDRVRGIIIHRSNVFDGPYERLASVSPDIHEYVDLVQRVKEIYFYRIEVVDVVGLSHVSMPVQGLSDTEPMAPPPTDVQARQGPNGVALYWQPTGPDAAHYKVERSFLGEESWVLVGDGVEASKEGPVWTDSIAKDNRVRSYRVRTVSLGGLVSDPSPVCTVQAVDGRVPSTPVDVAVRAMEGMVVISWRDPWAEDAGMFRANVERADTGSSHFTVLNPAPLEAGTSLFHDSTAVQGKPYAYRVVGISLAGVQGLPSLPSELKGKDPASTGPRLLMARRKADGISLEWPARERQGTGFNLYRSVDDGPAMLLKTLPIEASSFLDTATVKGAYHLYMIALVLPDGTESNRSEPVGVRWE